MNDRNRAQKVDITIDICESESFHYSLSKMVWFIMLWLTV